MVDYDALENYLRTCGPKSVYELALKYGVPTSTILGKVNRSRVLKRGLIKVKNPLGSCHKTRSIIVIFYEG